MKSKPPTDRFKGYRLSDCSDDDQGTLLYNGKIIVPSRELQVALIKAVHEGKGVGHGGIDKTLYAVQGRYYFTEERA